MQSLPHSFDPLLARPERGVYCYWLALYQPHWILSPSLFTINKSIMPNNLSQTWSSSSKLNTHISEIYSRPSKWVTKLVIQTMIIDVLRDRNMFTDNSDNGQICWHWFLLWYLVGSTSMNILIWSVFGSEMMLSCYLTGSLSLRSIFSDHCCFISGHYHILIQFTT